MADLWDRGIDLSSPEVRQTRTWRWLWLHIEGLLTLPPQVVVIAGRAERVPQTRLALRLDPPDLTTHQQPRR